jgi:hypothetical protein
VVLLVIGYECASGSFEKSINGALNDRRVETIFRLPPQGMLIADRCPHYARRITTPPVGISGHYGAKP